MSSWPNKWLLLILSLSMSGCANMAFTGIAATGGRGDDPVHFFGNFYERDERFKSKHAPYGYIHGIGYNAGLGFKVKGEF